MDVRRMISSDRDERELQEAMHVLAETIREASECLLDLQHAVETLHMVNEPSLAQTVSDEAVVCIRRAMQR